MGKKKKLSYIVEASDLKVRFVELKESIEAITDPGAFIPSSLYNYLIKKNIYEKTIHDLKTPNNQDYFKNEKMNNYAKFSLGTDNLTDSAFTEYNHRLRDYFFALPQKIQELKQVKRDLKALIKAADNRAPSLFKTGNVKESIREVIDLNEINQLLAFAEETRDNMTANRDLFISKDSTYYL
ncbi:hypothetical protein OQJ19_03575 [Fluoribacter gormanii]|uniref:Uncharacterized protein n=2 Tax=Fluoribacter gormanii TaxID=464 RepID=A0A377GGH8_9GAMM|nr:hypothetical protein [Fluoribacter gormanii]KTD05450.1 hypothetical protein Lgor_0283 [Fluoribacter gormanii]MCW8444546.1 hypothetical protein [Fluoribacter gormanii]MCW8469738.1 hypothetical protein [Fluoribacter gormanii]SIR76041.1 hypothetical protein SAMN05421777_12316 [Fluoribacter gormanii]STO23929.1 Uncharacterised protein [Fluoribacter gormanii]